MSKDQDLLRALLEALIGSGGDPQADDIRRRQLKIIADCVDLPLVNALSQWIVSQKDDDKPFTNGQICGTVAYWLAFSIAESVRREGCPESVVCSVTASYTDYIHNLVHAIYQDETKKSKK